MRKMWLFLAVFTASATFGAPFVTPGMIRRNGLTDAQYEQLWAIGKHPKIDIAAARDWVFRASRFQNVTNWLEICGRSNDFARLSYKLQGDNYVLGLTNSALNALNGLLSVSNAHLTVSFNRLYRSFTNQVAETVAYSNAYEVAKDIADQANAKIEDEIADLEAKIVKYEEYKTKYPLLKTVWNALIADAQKRIEILKATEESLNGK